MCPAGMPKKSNAMIDAFHVRRREQVQRDRQERPDRGGDDDAAHPDRGALLPRGDHFLLFRPHQEIMPLPLRCTLARWRIQSLQSGYVVATMPPVSGRLSSDDRDLDRAARPGRDSRGVRPGRRAVAGRATFASIDPWRTPITSDVGELRTAAGVPADVEVGLVGHSIGGLAALRWALTRPLEVTRLVLVDTSLTSETGVALALPGDPR